MTPAVPPGGSPPPDAALAAAWVPPHAAPTRFRWLAPVAVGTGALAGCVALGVLNPSDTGPVICPFRSMTGLDCPGCGMTRAVAHLARGRIADALNYNVLLVVAVPALVYLYVGWLAGSFGFDLPPLRLGRRANIVLLVVAVIFSVVRNLPIGIGRYLNSDPSLR